MDEYPNSSEATQQWAPEKPQERVDAEQKENAKVTTSIGVIQEILDWFDANAAQYKTTDGMGVDEKSSAEDWKISGLLAKKMGAAFESKAMSFRSEFAKYLKEDADEAPAE